MDVIQVIPDRFSSRERDLKYKLAGGGYSDKPFVRRPTRGIQLKEDTFATLRLVSIKAGNNELLVDAGSNRGGSTPLVIEGKRATDIYSNFLLQQVQEDRMEKQQILETFGEPYIFLFGERPRIMSFSGILANTQDFNWEAEWWHNYDNYLRGTKCVENDARVFLSFDNTLVGGYIVSASASKTSTERNFVNFQFQMFVTSYSNFSNIGNPYPANHSILDVNGETKTFETELDQYELGVWAPTPLTTTGAYNGKVLNSGPVNGNGQVSMPSLEQGLTNQLSTVLKAWSSAMQVARGVTSSVSSLASGDHVRVPVGFAGSTVFDEGPTVKLNQPQSGVLKFTTYGENVDEFVGVSDHYGSSRILIQAAMTDEDSLKYSQNLVIQATEAWKQNGVEIPEEQMGPISTFLVSKGIGLSSVMASAATTGAKGFADKVGNAAIRFANMLPNPATVLE